MAIVLELEAELAQQLQAESERLGISMEVYVAQLLKDEIIKAAQEARETNKG